jgi:hypothetical protein
MDKCLILVFIAVAVLAIQSNQSPLSQGSYGEVLYFFIKKANLKPYLILVTNKGSDSTTAKPSLYCYTCNENLKACSRPYDFATLRNYSTPCNGFCMKYRNVNDKNRRTKLWVEFFFLQKLNFFFQRMVSRLLVGCRSKRGEHDLLQKGELQLL